MLCNVHLDVSQIDDEINNSYTNNHLPYAILENGYT